ncbi:MAG: hypothetical protein ACLQU4_09255 [Limisphaerales bacterium]
MMKIKNRKSAMRAESLFENYEESCNPVGPGAFVLSKSLKNVLAALAPLRFLRAPRGSKASQAFEVQCLKQIQIRNDIF